MKRNHSRAEESLDPEELLSGIREVQPEYQAIQPAPELAHILKLDVDVKGRDIYLVGEISDMSGGEFVETLRYLERVSTDPVRLWISSPGGDVMSAFAINDAIRGSRVRVDTVGTGEVASAAGLLLACGKRRYVTPSCCFMAHESRFSGESDLGMAASKDRRKWEDWQHDHFADLMGTYAKGGKTFWKKVVEKGGEHWLLGGAAIVEAGVADAIWTGREQA